MKLTTQQHMLVEQRLANESRSVGIAYLLWFFLGVFGAHRFYLGRIGSGVGMLVLFWLGALTAIILIGWVLLLAYGVWWIVDAFLIPSMVDEDRRTKRTSIANEISAIASDVAE
jgi:TM2 domain-containing membrane protein YozV